MLEYYKLRIDTQSKKNVDRLMDLYAKRYFWSFEKIGTVNQHVHVYLETFHSHRTIRAMIRKLFGGGNGTYSMKVVEFEPLEYIGYMCKEHNTFYHNLPEDLMEKAKAYDDKVKLAMKAKKLARTSQLDILKEHVGDTKELFEIASKVVGYYQEKGLLYRRFYAISVVETIYLQNCDHEARYQMANDIYHSIRDRNKFKG